jgi:hypothetical protein
VELEDILRQINPKCILLAEAELDKAMLKEIAAKNVWSAPSVQGSWT